MSGFQLFNLAIIINCIIFLIWSYRLFELGIKKFNLKRTSALSLGLSSVLFSLGLAWNNFYGFVIAFIGLHIFLGSICIRPIFILGRDVFHVEPLESVECVLCLTNIAIVFCALSKAWMKYQV